MTTSTPLVTGLGGAIGCDYLQSHDQLIFVEFDGKISRINMVHSPVSTVSSGKAILHGNHGFDLDTGNELYAPDWSAYPQVDIVWDVGNLPQPFLIPKVGTKMALIGEVNFDDVSAAELLGLSYDGKLYLEPFEGDGGPVFAVITNSGNYAKVQVMECSKGYDLTIRWVTYSLGRRYEVLGTGYTQPEDIVVSADGQHAYVTERSGNLLRVDLTNADRAQATVVLSGMTAPHQIALDEEHGHAYVVEYARPGRLLRIDLTTGAPTVWVVKSGLDGAIGLLVTDDRRFAYVSEQPSGGGGRVSRIELDTGMREVLTTGVSSPFFLTWADPGEGAILTTERDPFNRVSLVDLTETPVSVSRVATGVPVRPSSVAVMAPDRLLLCSDSVVSELNLTAYVATGPILLGIGHVPFDRIVNGYADTTIDPGYFFQVKDAPFGGTLPLMVNHEGAYAAGARYYKVLVDGVAQQQSWSDYCWSTSTNRFELRTMNPDESGYFEVRPPHELWYNHWLGCRLNTSGLANRLQTIEVELYSAPDAGSLIDTDGLEVQIDNRWPTAKINQILHDGAEVKVCELVDSGSDKFTFNITAHDTEDHLKSWHLSALWGDNKSKSVDWDSYPPTRHPPVPPEPPRKWHGLTNAVVPDPSSPWDANVKGDSTSTRCAHTFYLTVWDRATDGYNRTIHRSHYHKSITIWLPLSP